jgi:DNA-binding CsgD family transcriptional regulator
MSKTMLDHARSEISPLPALAFQVAPGRDYPFHMAGAPLAAAFDLLRMSVILTNGSGDILYANRYARAMLKEQRCLRIGQGRLSAVNPKCASQLKQAIRRCTSGEPGALLPLGIAVPLSRTDEPTIAAWVLPIRSQPDDEQPQAAIFIRNAADLFSEEMFASTFSVTLGELRVLKLLFSGRSIEEISGMLKLSRNTVRTHVKALFAKTGTTRQAELLRLACFSIAPASAEAVV